MHSEDRFEMLVEVFDGQRTQLMEDTSDLDARIGVRVSVIESSNHLLLQRASSAALLEMAKPLAKKMKPE
jgi:hypothetical protein